MPSPRPGAVVLLALLVAVSTAACTFAVPQRYLPPPITNEAFADPVKVVNIPLPVIKTDPNEGVSLGALSAFLVHNARDEIGTMIVPQLNYNEHFGVTATLFAAFYPAPGRRWEVGLSRSSRVNQDYSLEFRDASLLDGALDVGGEVFAFTDGSARFFGFQSRSASRNETNYASEEAGFRLAAGYRLTREFAVTLADRFRHVEIGRGAVRTLPGLQDRFTPEQVPGIRGFVTHAQEIGLAFTTLDDPGMPTRGVLGRAAVEFSTRALGSTASYRHYTFEVKGFVPFDGSRYVTAIRAAYNQTLGDDVAFLERSILGGKSTLRGHGANRFIDSSYALLNIEERIRVLRYRLFNVNTDWEVAPFLDIGAVAKSLLDLRSRNFVINPGVGFRAVVRPNVVGRVDVGFGKEGPAIFATLGYRF
jgi:hypothetical protein